MHFGLNYVGSLVEQNVVTLNDCCELVQDLVAGQVDLVKEHPVTVLETFDQSSLDELKDEATT